MTRRKIGTSTLVALSCALAAAGLVGCEDEVPEPGGAGEPSASAPAEEEGGPLTGTRTLTVGESTVNVSCSGDPVDGRPLVVLLHGGGHDVTTLAPFQETLSANGRVCSYDRLGAGASDAPAGPQDYADVGETLTGVLDQIAGDTPVVLAGHSMGGLIAARYAPDHLDRVAGLVLMDATPATAAADMEARIPETATGDSAVLREETLAVYAGQNPEQLVFADGEVRPAGDIPVRVIQHGVRYLAAMYPEYGAGLEEDWTAGQENWLALSSDSEQIIAEESGHDIYLEAPEIATAAVEEVLAAAAG